jgi:GNAT superfamily N-acetyltransferase
MTEPLCRPLVSDADVHTSFPLMSVLRERIRADTFLQEVRRQQLQGYELVGAFSGTHLVAIAGVRRTHTLARGEHLFVDDLVTDPAHQGRGYATALLVWLARRAAAEGIDRIYLDARDTARSFYAQLPFRFLTSVPCWIEAAELARGGARVERSADAANPPRAEGGPS